QYIANAVYHINLVEAGQALAIKLAGVWNAAPPAVGTKFAASLFTQLDVLTWQSVPAYFNVTTASWGAIAQSAYGVPAGQATEGGKALAQMLTGDPNAAAPAVGTHLLRDPQFLSQLNVTIVSSVAPYYILPANPTWPGICQTVFGVSDANAVQALKDAIPNGNTMTLVAGTHLTMPAQIQYVPNNPGPTMYLQTDVIDPLNLTTTYRANSQGYISNLFTPSIGGSPIETRYDYDTRGNLLTITQDPTGLNRITTMTYDANDN